MPNDNQLSPVAAALAMAKLRALRMSLLPLHQALLDYERARYERVHGRIDSAQQALRLVMQDEWFAWLRPLSALIVQIDERLADDAPVKLSELRDYQRDARGLLQQDLGGALFRDQYHDALQQSPEVIVAHGKVISLLNE